MKVHYTDTPETLSAEMLTGFFVGWPNPPVPERHLAILRGSYRVWLALADERCIGFINALSDGVFYAYLPLLEVLPAYQGRGVGRRLVGLMMESLSFTYAVDVCCDEDLVPFYRKAGFFEVRAMARRTYARQAGEPLG